MKLGTDPEFVLMYKGKPLSAIGILPRKDGKCTTYFDNVLAECAIPPEETEDAFVAGIREYITSLAANMKPYTVNTIAAIKYPKKQLQALEAREAGCNPEMCAYTYKSFTPNPVQFAKTPWRTAGGHLHIDFNVTLPAKIALIHALDLFVGYPLSLIDKDKSAPQRRKLYGRAGRFRVTPYGVEYRTPGNFWLASPRYVRLVWKLVDNALSNLHQRQDWLYNFQDWESIGLKSPGTFQMCERYNPNWLQHCINRSVYSEYLYSIATQFLNLDVLQELNYLKTLDAPPCLYDEWEL